MLKKWYYIPCISYFLFLKESSKLNSIYCSLVSQGDRIAILLTDIKGTKTLASSIRSKAFAVIFLFSTIFATVDVNAVDEPVCDTSSDSTIIDKKSSDGFNINAFLEGYWRSTESYSGYKFILFGKNEVHSNFIFPQKTILEKDGGKQFSLKTLPSGDVIIRIEIIDKGKISISSNKANEDIFFRSTGEEISKYLETPFSDAYGVWVRDSNVDAYEIIIRDDFVFLNGVKYIYNSRNSGNGYYLSDEKTGEFILVLSWLDNDRLGIDSLIGKGIFRRKNGTPKD